MDGERTPELDGTTALYLAAAILFSLFVAIFGGEIKMSGKLYNPGFIARIFLFIFGIPGAYFGLKVGRWVRDILMPDMIITSGGITQLAKTKLFWAVGPQAIGFFIGYCLTAGIVIAIAA